MLADGQKVEIEGAEGVLVYRDFSDPDLFYYTSTRPAVARKGGKYQLTMVRYDRPLGDRAGMLSVVVDLEPDSSDLEKMRSQIQAVAPRAAFQQILWSSGTVAAAITAGKPVFGTPSLLGSNSAALCFPLTIDQYALLKQMDGNAAAPPVSVVYSLDYEAFRPEYQFSIEFNEERFRNWVQKKCSANFIVINVEKVETFEDLQESGVIRIVSVNQTGGTAPDGFRLAFLRSLQSILTPSPRFAPAPEAGGGSWLPGFDCSTVQDMQNIARKLDTRMEVSGAVSRRAYLQGTLAGLVPALRANPEVELPTQQRFTQAVTVRCYTEFDGRPLDAVNVSIDPSTFSPSTRLFEAARTGDWQIDLVHPPGTTSDYTYQCALQFRDYDRLVSGSVGIRREQIFLDIVPREFYSYRLYTVNVSDQFPWDLIRSVRIALQGPGNLGFNPRELLLTQTSPSGSVEAFAPSPVDFGDVTFTATYQPLFSKAFSIEELPAGPIIFLNPLRRRIVTFRADESFDWKRHAQAMISVGPALQQQLWAAGAGSFKLAPQAPSARFTYWYADRAVLNFKTALMENNKLIPSQLMQASGSDVVISDRI